MLILPTHLSKDKDAIQDIQFLLIGNTRYSSCFFEQNNTAYCLPVDKNSLM